MIIRDSIQEIRKRGGEDVTFTAPMPEEQAIPSNPCSNAAQKNMLRGSTESEIRIGKSCKRGTISRLTCDGLLEIAHGRVVDPGIDVPIRLAGEAGCSVFSALKAESTRLLSSEVTKEGEIGQVLSPRDISHMHEDKNVNQCRPPGRWACLWRRGRP
jgi:hypothetical protein